MQHKDRKEDGVTDEMIMNHIYVLRGQKVMIDLDLVKLYQLENSGVRTIVNRNTSRFPADFMFKLNEEDELSLVRQDSEISAGHRIMVTPIAFTEQGLAMLAGLMKSKRAIAVSIRIIRIFTLIRQIVPDFPELYREMEQFKNNLLRSDT
ncbi:ORF6N domain-containing protein [Pedobacter cryoconitis]|uniref:ORF6N domain-containing protein n=1 Tax=Pedobacter cryoconitis TaxID=188932 RepID=A0A327RZG6_9SPHI|nr:ORF6N domain-containing protein [Pedobacter cryoconitis]RAJ22179.1 ORF6N domain-containing protein [Pedobacter cryoconitis]